MNQTSQSQSQSQHQHFITNTQAIHRNMQAQSSQPNVGSQIGDNITIVLVSTINSAKPTFNQHLPSNNYNTHTKIDEVFVEIDEEDLTQTREPDEPEYSRPQSING
jgi:hypothetical protein